MKESREDLKQEAIMIILEKGGDVKDIKLIHSIMQNLAKGNQYVGRLKEEITFDGEVEDIEDLTDIELALDVRRAVSKLTEEEQRIVDFVFIRGWSGRMLARKVGRSPSSIHERILKLKDKLKKELKDLV